MVTTDEALEVIADEVVGAVLEEMLDSGLWDTYVDAEPTDDSSNALRACLAKRLAARPDAARLTAALGRHVRIGYR